MNIETSDLIQGSTEFLDQFAKLEYFNLLLLLSTVGFAVQTQVYQRRTSLREALEQMEPMRTRGYYRLITVLNGFKYRPWGSVTTIEIQRRQFHRGQPASRSTQYEDLLYWKNNQEKTDFCRALENLTHVRSAKFVDLELVVEITSGNPVKVRKTASILFRTIKKADEIR